jgi:hypothetical protein
MRRIFSALILFFPARFRRAFGSDMLETFDQRWREHSDWRTALRIIVDMISAGMLERFSGRRYVKESGSTKKGDSPMTTFIYEMKYAVRLLLRSPGFSVVALATLALGIGINTAMFSVAHTALWSSLPYPNPDRLVAVGEVDAKNPDIVWGASYLNYRDWQSRAASFAALAAPSGCLQRTRA